MMHVKICIRSLLHPSFVRWVAATYKGGTTIREKNFVRSRFAARLPPGRPVALVSWRVCSVSITEEPADTTLAAEMLTPASPFALRTR